MIPLAIPNLSGNEARYLTECIESTFISSVGPFVDQFETTLANECGATGAVATSSGTAALHAALWASGVRRDQLVILPSMTFIASANAIAYCGAKPWLIDIEPEAWTMDPEALERALETKTEASGQHRIHIATRRRVAAIMPVYTLGTPANMDRIAEIAAHYHLPVVADAAAALGASYRSKPIAQIGANFSALSFNGNKTLTTGGGGAILARDANLLSRVRHLTTTARISRNYDHDEIGFNYRMTNLEAAVGCAQLERLDTLVAAKRRIRQTYDEAFRDLSHVAAFPSPDWAESACWFSGFIFENGKRSAIEICNELVNQGVDARPMWKPIHLQTPYAACPFEEATLSERVWSQAVTLPCSTSISDAELDQVISATRNVVS